METTKEPSSIEHVLEKETSYVIKINTFSKNKKKSEKFIGMLGEIVLKPQPLVEQEIK